VNVIVGPNASGKTALLEGIFLTSGGGMEPVLRLRGWRGYENAFGGTLRAIYSALWSDLFFGYDVRKVARVSLAGDEGEDRSITITGLASELRLDFSGKDSPPAEVWSAAVKFEWDGPFGRRAEASPIMIGGQLVPQQQGGESVIEAAMFNPGSTFAASEAAAKFSDLSKLGLEREIVDAFCSHFNRVTDLSIEVLAGQPMIFATMREHHQKVPVASLSTGMNKLLGILIAIPSFRRGVVLIDELENGFHYSRLPLVWKMILEMARQHDCQVFASTHSRECLQALVDAAGDDTDQVSLIRATHRDGASVLHQFAGATLRAGVEHDEELR